MIRKIGFAKYRLYSRRNGKNLGTFGSRARAEKRERAVKFFARRSALLEKSHDD